MNFLVKNLTSFYGQKRNVRNPTVNRNRSSLAKAFVKLERMCNK